MTWPDLVIITCLILFTWMSRAEDRSEFFNFKKKINKFSLPYLDSIQHQKCIPMSTNKPSIGSVILVIALVILGKFCQILIFLENCGQCVKR